MKGKGWFIPADFRQLSTFIFTTYILKILKKSKLNDWFFQKIAFSNLLLHRIEFLMDFNQIRCTFVALRGPPFMASGAFAKIIGVSYIQISANAC